MIHDKNLKLQINDLLKNYGVTFSEREIECAINLYNLNTNFNMTSNSSLKYKDSILCSHINNQVDQTTAINFLISTIQNILVTKEHLEWIENNNHRLIIWLINRLSNCYNFTISIYGIKNLYKTFLYNLDRINISIDEKILFLQNCASEWNFRKLPDSEIKWIDQKKASQIEWAWLYLAKHNLQINCFNHFSNNDEKYESILACLDNLSYSLPETKELILLKMKKTWSQKKFRDSGKAKKPYHLPLTQETQAQLEELVKLKNMNKSKVLEAIILKEFNELKLK
ncbi:MULTISPECIES: hypothetical protein [Acinetobacter]|nr:MULTISPECIES: hypothetical protein [unclassified Acinetobacter]